MKFIKWENDKNYLSDIRWPNWEYFSVLLQEDKDSVSEMFDVLWGLVWIDDRDTETALVYNTDKWRMDTQYAIKEWDMRAVLEKAKTFDDAVDIFFKAKNEFNDWSNITSDKEYFVN